MRAHSITIMSRRRRRARRRAIALVLAVCALAIPASASAYSSPNAITGGTEQSSQPVGGSDYSSVNSVAPPSESSSAGGGSAAAAGHAQRTPTELGQTTATASGGFADVDPGYSSLNATTGQPTGEPTLASGSPSGGGQGFDWSSALVGAGSAMALVALSGAAFLTVRRRTEVSPSASTS